MDRLIVLLMVSTLLPACGHPVQPSIRPMVPVVAAASQPDAAPSVKGIVRDAIIRYLAKKHPNMTMGTPTVARTVKNGQQAFSAKCTSPRQVRRIEGYYDVAKRMGLVV
jgi:hypothetical protein